MGNWVGPGPFWTGVENLTPYRDLIPGPSILHTDYTVLAHPFQVINYLLIILSFDAVLSELLTIVV